MVWGQKSSRSVSTIKNWFKKKKALNVPLFSSSLLVIWPSASIQFYDNLMFSSDFWSLLTYLKKCSVFSDTTLTSMNSSWALVFIFFFSLKMWTAALFSPYEAKTWLSEITDILFLPQFQEFPSQSGWLSVTIVWLALQLDYLLLDLKGCSWKADSSNGSLKPLEVISRIHY